MIDNKKYTYHDTYLYIYPLFSNLIGPLAGIIFLSSPAFISAGLNALSIWQYCKDNGIIVTHTPKYSISCFFVCCKCRNNKV